MAQPDYQAMARELAKEYGVQNVDAFMRLINQESGWNPKATNKSSGAAGIAQIMPATAGDPGYGVKPVNDPYDPVQGLTFAADYFGEMEKLFDGDTALAAAAYNAGPGTVQKAGGVPNIAETQHYVGVVTGDGSYGGGSTAQGEVMSTPGTVRRRADGRPLAPPSFEPGDGFYEGIMRDRSPDTGGGASAPAPEEPYEPDIVDRLLSRVSGKEPGGMEGLRSGGKARQVIGQGLMDWGKQIGSWET